MSWLQLSASSGTVAAGVLLVVGIALRRVRRRPAQWVSAAALETALICGLFALWQIANGLAHTHEAGGVSRGEAIWNFERAVHLPSETWLQRLFLSHPDIVRASNTYYAFAHLTGMLVFLVWLWLRHREHYPRWRNILVGFTGISLLVQMVPVAPPRLIPGTGLVDTALRYGQSVYGYLGSDFADQYAAMPSVHVGWALLIAAACVSVCSPRWRWIGITHAVLTTFAVTVTANHYWLDGIVAAAILVAVWLAERAWARRSDPAARELVALVAVPDGPAVERDRLHPVMPAVVGDDLRG